MTPASFNPYVALKAASRGDLSAQRALAEYGLNLGLTQHDTEAMFDGLCFARLAAAQGDIGDRGRVLAMLSLASQMCPGTEHDEMRAALAGEALAIIAMAADAGGTELQEQMECGLFAVIEECSPAEVALGKELQRLMAAAEKGE